MKSFSTSKSQLRGLLFYDAAYLKRNKPQPGRSSLAPSSAGLGLRLSVVNLVASTDYAFIIDPAGNHTAGDGRWHFKVQLTF